MGSSNSKAKLEELWESGEDIDLFNIFTDGVMPNEDSTTSGSGVLKGSLVLGSRPSQETLQAFKFVKSLERSSLEKINRELEKLQKTPESKYKKQCLILLRHLYLIRSKPPVWVNEEDFRLLQPAPLDWAHMLG